MPTNKQTRSKVAKVTAKEKAWNRKVIMDSEGNSLTVECAKLMHKRCIKEAHTEYTRTLEELRELQRQKNIEKPESTHTIEEKKWLVAIAAYGHLYNDNIEKATYKRDKYVRYASEKLDDIMEQDGTGKHFMLSLDGMPSDGIISYEGTVNSQAVLTYADSEKNALANMDYIFKTYRFLWKC